jgi:hypothetical protein
LAAQHEGTRQRLISTGVLPERVDALIAAREAEAARYSIAQDGPTGVPGFDWIVAHGRRESL